MDDYRLAGSLVREAAEVALVQVQAQYLPRWNLEETRATEVPKAQMPWLGFYAESESAELLADAGTAPNYKSTVKLHLILRVANTVKREAERQRDWALARVKWGLLSGPPFMAAPIEKVTAITIVTAIDASGETNVANAVMELDVIVREQFFGPDGAPLVTFAATIEPGSPVSVAIEVDATFELPQ